jgi:hypothetical protein
MSFASLASLLPYINSLLDQDIGNKTKTEKERSKKGKFYSFQVTHFSELHKAREKAGDDTLSPTKIRSAAVLCRPFFRFL